MCVFCFSYWLVCLVKVLIIPLREGSGLEFSFCGTVDNSGPGSWSLWATTPTVAPFIFNHSLFPQFSSLSNDSRVSLPPTSPSCSCFEGNEVQLPHSPLGLLVLGGLKKTRKNHHSLLGLLSQLREQPGGGSRVQFFGRV